VGIGASAPPSTWNGTGRVGTTSFGVVTATTSNEALNGMTCQYTPISGTTTIAAGSNTAVITYQGGTLCDMTASANWTLNGAPQANLTGVSCDIGHDAGTRRGSKFVLAAFAVGIVAAARRRRRA
jgi:hypothetical protein